MATSAPAADAVGDALIAAADPAYSITAARQRLMGTTQRSACERSRATP
jgi:hypothetical protein